MELLSLKRCRLLAGLSQQELATKVGVSQPTYQRWESGSGKPPAEKINRLAKALGVKVAELEGKTPPFDYLGYNNKFEDDRRYFGEVALHFTEDKTSLILPISIAQRDSLIEQLADEVAFPTVSSLDNRTVIFRAQSILDVFFSSEAYDDFGPEHDEYKHGPGIYPDDEFWEIVEFLDVAEDFPPDRVEHVLRKVKLSDEQLNELIESKEVHEDEREKLRAEADALTKQFEEFATLVTWRHSNGRTRTVYVEDDEVIFRAASELQVIKPEETGMLYLPAEGYHRSLFFNPWSIDYFTCPTHRFNRGMLKEREREVDRAG